MSGSSERSQAFDAAGVALALDAHPATLSALLPTFRSLPPTAADPRAVVRIVAAGADWLVHVEGDAPPGAVPSGGVLPAVQHLVNRLVAEHSPYVLVHAGAVVVDGVAVVMPGVSGAGKSTLTAGLVIGGAGYLTDEAAALAGGDGGVTVQPYAKPLSIRVPSRAPLAAVLGRDLLDDTTWSSHDWIVPVDTIGVVAPAATVGLLVFPTFRPDAAAAELQPISPAEALYRAGEHASLGRGAPAFRLLEALVRQAPAWELVWADLPTAVAAVRDLVPLGDDHGSRYR